MSDVTESSRLELLEERLNRVEDELAITRLIASYGPFVDGGDADAVAGMWTEDGVYDVDEGHMAGRSQLAAMVRSRAHQGWIAGGCAHFLGPAHVTLHGDTAVAVCHSLMVLNNGGEFGQDAAFGVRRATAHHFELVRTEEGWRVDPTDQPGPRRSPRGTRPAGARRDGPAGVTTFADLVAARADDDSVALWFEGRSWTWREVVAEARARAPHWPVSRRRPGRPTRGRPDRRVRPGTSASSARTLPSTSSGGCGLALVGDTYVGINPTRRGADLAHDIAFTDCGLLVVDEAPPPAARGCRRTATRCSRSAPAPRRHRDADRASTPIADGIDPAATLSLVFTSGTTVGPEGRRLHPGPDGADRPAAGRAARAHRRRHLLRRDADVPLQRADGRHRARRRDRRARSCCAASSARRPSCPTCARTASPSSTTSASRWPTSWPRPEQPDDADNPLRIAFGNEASERAIAEFSRRFGCQVIDSFGSSEGEVRIIRHPDAPPGSLGVAAEGIVVLDPATGRGVPAGAVRRRRRAAQRRGGDRRDRPPAGRRAVRGLLQEPRRRGRAGARRPGLVRRPRLPRRRRLLVLRRPHLRLAAGRRREPRCRADRAAAGAGSPPSSRSRSSPCPTTRSATRCWPWPSSAAGQRRSTPQTSRPSSTPSPTSARSGRRRSCGSCRRFPAPRPTRSSSATSTVRGLGRPGPVAPGGRARRPTTYAPA